MEEQSISRNYIFNTAYQVLALVSPLITTPYVSRVLSADGVGVYSYTSSIVALFTMFACLGTTVYGQRLIAQNRDDDYSRSKCFWEIELLSVCSTAIVAIAWIFFLIFYPEYKFYFLILSFDLISNAFDVSWFYNGIERIPYIVIRNSAVRIAGIILIFIFVNSREDLWIYILILTGTKLLGNISMWFSLPRFVNRVRLKDIDIRPHIKETIAYFIPTAAASVYTYLDKVMLGAITGSAAENGYYEQAEKIIKIGYTVVVSVNTVMSSRLSYLFAQENKDEILHRLEQALAFIFTLGIPITFGIAGVSFNFVPWFFGSGYEKVVTLMVISSPLVVIMSLHNYLSALYLIPSGQRVRSTKGVFVGAGVNFLLNLLLIPHLQSIGALIATLIAESSIFVVYLYMSKDFIPLRLFVKYLPKQLIAAIVMLIVVLLIGNGRSGSILITIAQVCVGAVIYFVVLLVLREQFTVRMVKQVLRRLYILKDN